MEKSATVTLCLPERLHREYERIRPPSGLVCAECQKRQRTPCPPVLVCAWCGTHLREQQSELGCSGGVSHGICVACCRKHFPEDALVVLGPEAK